MGFIWQRSSMIAIAVAIVLGAGAVAFARPHQISEPLLGTVAMQPCCVRRHLQSSLRRSRARPVRTVRSGAPFWKPARDF